MQLERLGRPRRYRFQCEIVFILHQQRNTITRSEHRTFWHTRSSGGIIITVEAAAAGWIGSAERNLLNICSADWLLASAHLLPKSSPAIYIFFCPGKSELFNASDGDFPGPIYVGVSDFTLLLCLCRSAAAVSCRRAKPQSCIFRNQCQVLWRRC